MKIDGSYTIHLDSFLFLKQLGLLDKIDEYTHVEVPNLEGLDEAICLVNKAFYLKVQQIKEWEKEQFKNAQYHKLKKYFESGEDNARKIQDILEETISFYKPKGEV